MILGPSHTQPQQLGTLGNLAVRRGSGAAPASTNPGRWVGLFTLNNLWVRHGGSAPAAVFTAIPLNPWATTTASDAGKITLNPNATTAYSDPGAVTLNPWGTTEAP
jgi:hypothetical protein